MARIPVLGFRDVGDCNCVEEKGCEKCPLDFSRVARFDICTSRGYGCYLFAALLALSQENISDVIQKLHYGQARPDHLPD